MANIPFGRIDETYLFEHRGATRETFNAWKMRIRAADLLLEGSWHLNYPNMIAVKESPMVTNLGETFLRDVSRLVAEVPPAIKSVAKNDSEPAKVDQLVREAVADTYWAMDDADIVVPQLAMDLIES